jgi:hypothetical protein
MELILVICMDKIGESGRNASNPDSNSPRSWNFNFPNLAQDTMSFTVEECMMVMSRTHQLVLIRDVGILKED